MVSKKFKQIYRQRLPHIQPPGYTFFVTFRLFESIPRSKLKEIKLEYEEKMIDILKIKDEYERNLKTILLRTHYFIIHDRILDKISLGPIYLKQEKIAIIIKNQLQRFDGIYYNLEAYSIMPNHVHMLIDTSIQLPKNGNDIKLTTNYVNLDQIMKRIKGASAIYANKVLARSGQFWERESFDIYIRNTKMFNKVVCYILNNPVKAGIVEKFEDHK
jgi:REP element-mobilizing transposase RayT